MKVLVLGSGVIGVTTAYVLASRGHRVEVVDRQPESAMECSFANGGQLSYSYAEPWPTPGVLLKLPKWLLHKDSPLIFRPRWDVEMFTWGLKFLRNCTPARAEENCLNILRLGLYSRAMMHQLMSETNIEFDHAPTGILHIVANEKEMQALQKQADFQAKFGCDQRTLSREEVLALEPSLSETTLPIYGGIHSHMDESADIFPFTQGLARICAEKFGVKFHYNTTVQTIHTEGARITHVSSSAGEHTADAYVMAMGAYSPLFTKPLGVKIPVYPMKGYSLTVPRNEHVPALSVMDGAHKIVFTPLGNRMRVAGTAELAGYNHDISPDRITPMLATSRRLFPKGEWDSPKLETWACLRPSTPNSVPILGACNVENMFLNTGHGTLGWTQAAGSAYIVADIMEKRIPAISMQGYGLMSA